MKDEIKNYILTEKKLSRLKLAMLSRLDKNYAKRLMAKEEFFIGFDFFKFNFKTLEECRSAVDLFKISRSEFFKKYSNDAIYLDSKISEIKKYANSIEVKDNKIDNFPFRSLSQKYLRKENGELKKISLKRIAILKASLLSCAKFIEDTSSTDIRFILDNFHQSFIDKSFDKNLLSELELEIIDKHLLGFKNIMSMYSKTLFQYAKKTNSTGVIITPINHKGNERVQPIVIRLLKNNGQNILIKKNKFSNHPKNGDYYKCIKINEGQIGSVEEIDWCNSKVICNFSRREAEYNLENIFWIKFVLDKILN